MKEQTVMEDFLKHDCMIKSNINILMNCSSAKPISCYIHIPS